jgi:hypothetical protein
MLDLFRREPNSQLHTASDGAVIGGEGEGQLDAKGLADLGARRYGVG